MHQMPVFIYVWVFLTYFPRETPIYCGATSISTNAYFLGKDVLKVEKCAIFWWQGNLMNRLIHRSWGEGFPIFFLDLSANFSLFSSAFAYCSWQGIEKAILQGRAGNTG
jgi:hypothetical protein